MPPSASRLFPWLLALVESVLHKYCQHYFNSVVFRIGKPLDHLQTILKSLDIKDEVVRTSTILKSAGYGTWLLFDCLQWVIDGDYFSIDLLDSS